MSRCVGLVRLGLCRYKDALRIQESIATRLKQGDYAGLSGILILVQHPPVYTYGIRREALTKQDVNRLRDLGADVEYAGRGGLVTFHGPGQLVAWPVLNLKEYAGVKKHVNSLEESVILTCQKLGLVDVARNPLYPGVWRNDAKICALGVRASRYITTHGLAINVSTNLSWFDHIVPCGIIDKEVTSISKELKRNIDVEDVEPLFLQSFTVAFSSDIVEIPIKYDFAATNS